MGLEDVDAREPFSHGGRCVLPWCILRIVAVPTWLRYVHMGCALSDDEMI